MYSGTFLNDFIRIHNVLLVYDCFGKMADLTAYQ